MHIKFLDHFPHHVDGAEVTFRKGAQFDLDDTIASAAISKGAAEPADPIEEQKPAKADR